MHDHTTSSLVHGNSNNEVGLGRSPVGEKTNAGSCISVVVDVSLQEGRLLPRAHYGRGQIWGPKARNTYFVRLRINCSCGAVAISTPSKCC